jgi:glycosyltransferase involved in cell wall biosynthesis
LRCFAALSEQTLQDFEVVLVDNGSVDNTIDELRPDSYKFPIIIKKLHKNMGFAVTNNIGPALRAGSGSPFSM